MNISNSIMHIKLVTFIQVYKADRRKEMVR